MESSLLATKRQIPALPVHAVSRSRLIEILERSLPHYKLIRIAAPAGYGKTTLLSQWARTSRYPVAWFTVEEADNDPERFFRYLLAAWGTTQPDVMQSQLGILLSAMAPDMAAVQAAFVNVANDISRHTAVVLDDYHLIDNPILHNTIAFLLDHIPPKLHFVLAGRGEPPLPLARYRAMGAMLELQTRDLRFLPEEANTFLNQEMGLDLTLQDVGQLQEKLEGWIVSLQLVALSMKQGLLQTNELVVSGRQRFIADYLHEDVLNHLPEDSRQFLLQTSILDRLCGSLCTAVTDHTNAQQMLETLEQEDLFLVPLDDKREWFRYHHLFADFLQEALKQRDEDTAVLHRRAARWYLTHDLPEQAYRHALAGDDVELVIRVFERYVQPMLIGGELKSLNRWLESLPETWHADHPIIDLFQTGFLLFTGQLEASLRHVELVEHRLANAAGEKDRRLQLARVNAMRCSIACFQDDLAQAETFADQAFQDLPEQDFFFRAIIYGSLGDTYRRHGRWRDAEKCYIEMLDFINTPAFRMQSVHIFGALADLDLRRGRLRSATNYWRKALTIIQERKNWGRFSLPLIGWVHIRLAELLYEWNELTEAWSHLSSGLERAELGGDIRAMIAGYLIAGRMRLTERDFVTAETYLEKVRPLLAQAHFPHWRGRFQRLQVEIWLAQNRLSTAASWVDKLLQGSEEGEQPSSNNARLAMARVLIAKGDTSSLSQALKILNDLLTAAAKAGRMGIQIETLAIQAIATKKSGDTVRALTQLEQALRLAAPEEYVRSFADLGLPLARLLQEAHIRHVMVDYTEAVLAAFGNDIASSQPGQPVLPEPLTKREAEVLALLAAGLTNQEIAAELIISAGTVKKHASNIYGKLRVNGRTEAAARARELHLLD